MMTLPILLLATATTLIPDDYSQQILERYKKEEPSAQEEE